MKKVFVIFIALVFGTFGYSLELAVQGIPSLNIYSDVVSLNFNLGLGMKVADLSFSVFNIPSDTIKINADLFFNFFSTEDRRYYNLGLMLSPSYNAKVFEINKVNIFVLKLGLGFGIGYQGIYQKVFNVNFDEGSLLLAFESKLDVLYRFISKFYVGLSLGYDVLVDPSGKITLAYSPKIGIPVIYEF